MAAHMVSIARREYNADWTFASASSSSSRDGQASAAGVASASGAGQEMEAAPLRSGIATMEPNEGAAAA